MESEKQQKHEVKEVVREQLPTVLKSKELHDTAMGASAKKGKEEEFQKLKDMKKPDIEAKNVT